MNMFNNSSDYSHLIQNCIVWVDIRHFDRLISVILYETKLFQVDDITLIKSVQNAILIN